MKTNIHLPILHPGRHDGETQNRHTYKKQNRHTDKKRYDDRHNEDDHHNEDDRCNKDVRRSDGHICPEIDSVAAWWQEKTNGVILVPLVACAVIFSL